MNSNEACHFTSNLVTDEIFSRTGQPDFSSAAAYNSYCRKLTEWYANSGAAPGGKNEEFDRHFDRIKSGGPKVIATGWGGVDIVEHEHPRVKKFLVVSAGKYLAFEKHAEKTETLFGKEGLGILVYRPAAGQELRSVAVEPGFEITLQPGQEHCLIALSNLLVLEESIDPKGMDEDLIFIFVPE